MTSRRKQNAHAEDEEEQQSSPRKIAKRVKGQIREYHYLRSVSDTIHVYARSHVHQHNHPVVPRVKRKIHTKPKVLMPDANPPPKIHTPDNIEWQFLQTLPDYPKLHQFRLKNYSSNTTGDEKSRQIRFYCYRRSSHKCRFKLLAIKTATKGYHVYKHAEHNKHHGPRPKTKRTIHTKPIIIPDNPPTTVLNIKRKLKMSTKPKALLPDANTPKTFCTRDNIEWHFLQTLPDYLKLQQFRRKNHSNQTTGDEKSRQIRFYCYRRSSAKCRFKLLAIKSAKNGYDVYKYAEHNNHSRIVLKKDVQQSAGNQQNMCEEEPMEDKEEENGKNGEECELVDDVTQLGERDVPIKIEEIEEMPCANSRQKTLKLKLKLAKANKRVYKWMAGIEPNEIGETIGDWDKVSLMKMVEMADQEIREHPQKLNLWLPWLKCAIPKCSPQIDGFNARFKALIKLTLD